MIERAGAAINPFNKRDVANDTERHGTSGPILNRALCIVYSRGLHIKENRYQMDEEEWDDC